MSSTTTPFVVSHHQTRSAANISPITAVSQVPMNPYHTNIKSYADNSQSNLDTLPPPTTPPRTPQKTNHYSFGCNEHVGAGVDGTSKQKSKGKNRQRNILASPVNSRKSTPPSIRMQSTGASTSIRPVSTPSTNAYAGPTFHASPAPSALPIPRFFSRPVPDSPRTRDTMTNNDDSSSSSNNSPTPPTALISPPPTRQEESPLDFFFKADREEKARARSASLLHGTTPSSGPFSLPTDSPQNIGEALTASNYGRNRATHFIGGSSSAMFAMELDSTNSPGKPYGPAFSTPYNERINAARSRTVSTSPSSQTSVEQPLSKDRSEALKAYLFLGRIPSPPLKRPIASSDVFSGTPPPPPANIITHSQFSSHIEQAHTGTHQSRQSSSPLQTVLTPDYCPRVASRSSSLRQEVSPTIASSETQERSGYPYSTSANPAQPHERRAPLVSSTIDSSCSSNHSTTYNPSTSDTQITDLKGMEDSLRRILKIEPAGDYNVHSDRLGKTPVAVVTVPKHISNRLPSLNDMNHGVIGS